MNKKIPIALMTDHNYVLPTSVMIKSLIENKSLDTKYDIFILGDSLNASDKKLLNKFASNDICIKILDIKNDYADFANRNPNMSNTTFLKFKISTLLNKYDKILYIDTDTIILKDLTNLYNTDLKDTYAGVVGDYYLTNAGLNKKFGLNIYFNAGVILFNAKKIREENLIKVFEKTYLENDEIFEYHDQDTLNVVFNNNITILPVEYNWMVSNLYFKHKEIKNFYNITTNLTEYSPSIVHFTIRLKPWKYKYSYFNKEWLKYYSLLDYKIYDLNLKAGLEIFLYVFIRNKFNLQKVDFLRKKFVGFWEMRGVLKCQSQR